MSEQPPGEIIGANVRALRDAGMYSRHDLAERSGVSVPNIARLEAGKTPRPRRTTIEKLAKTLEVPVERLLEGTDTAPLGPAPPLPKREESAFIIAGRIVDGEYRMVVFWNVPEEEREQYSPKLEAMLGTGYLEDELSPEAAAVLAAS